MKLKSRIKYSKDLIDAASKRVKDVDHYVFSTRFVNEEALKLIAMKQTFISYIPLAFDIFDANNKNASIKDLKYFINIINFELNKLERESENFSNYIHSLISKLESEALEIEATVKEKQLKFFSGSSSTYYCNFSRESDVSLSEINRDFTIDHKTKFGFEPKDTASVIRNLGITLPIESVISIPIVKIEIINELTTIGDTLKPLIVDDPMNLLFRNKVFNYSVLFKGHERTRRLKRKHAQLGLYFELGSRMPLNSIKIKSNSIAAFNVKDILYLDESNQEVSVSIQNVNNGFESNFLFDAIETDRIIIVLEQKTPAGTGVFKEREKILMERILDISTFTSGTGTNVSNVDGYLYDISIDTIEMNLISFRSKGIYRSDYREVSNLSSFNLSDSTIQIPIANEENSLFQQSVTFTDQVYIEKYAGLKFFDTNGGLLLNEKVPLLDNSAKQIEYLDRVGDEFRFKLFPLLHYYRSDLNIIRIDLVEQCPEEENIYEGADYSHTEIPELVDESYPDIDFIVSDDQYTLDAIEEMREGLLNQHEEWTENGNYLEYIITEIVVNNLLQENIVPKNVGTIDDIINHYGLIDIKDYTLTTGLVLPMDQYFAYEVNYTNGQATVSLLDPSVGIQINSVLPQYQGRSSIINANLYRLNVATAIQPSYTTSYNTLLFSNPNSPTTLSNLFNFTQADINKNNETLSLLGFETVQDGTSQNVTQAGCLEFYKLTFDEEHTYRVGSHFQFYLSSYQVFVIGTVYQVLNSTQVLVAKNLVGTLPNDVLGVDLDLSYAYSVPSNALNVEVFEGTTKLVIGSDYLISLDNGSTWLSYLPHDQETNRLIRKATAGDFLIKVHNLDLTKKYIARYFVLPKQFLSKNKNIKLVNGIIEIDEPLASNEGVISSIFIMRNGFGNRYLSPIISEYTINLFEENPRRIKKGLKYNQVVFNKNTRNTLNVS